MRRFSYDLKGSRSNTLGKHHVLLAPAEVERLPDLFDGQTGAVALTVDFDLLPDGKLSDAQVTRSSGNTILITGGSAGIGLALATLLSEQGNHVIITGRNKEKLEAVTASLPNTDAIVSDVTSGADTENLVDQIKSKHPRLNVVINNAGNAYLYDLGNSTDAFDLAGKEMLTNYLSVIRLNEKLLPVLKSQPQAAIVNVSSIVAYVPGSLATYSASKAALHSYTQSLRIALEESSVKVFELMPPLVDTEFSSLIGGKNGISPLAVADTFLEGFTSDNLEIRVGQTADLYRLFLSSPETALDFMRNRAKTVAD
ncbi:MAG: SDR family NAD(P)-dependent oxidoreductase [Sphingobacteriales bacterium]|nr:MAG: SDR family NAD(P)-dependent oxidoreductase [Sphingobacteriales bacterium]